MQLSEYKNIYENEETHFYYVGNHNIILSLVSRYLKVPRTKAKILDAGCGTGLLAKKLGRFGKVWGIDISPEALKFARKRKVQVRMGSVTRLPFGSRSLDLVVSTDVIYHRAVKSDKKALKEFFRVLKSNGVLILRVPANKWLIRSSDAHVHTRERYEPSELKRKLRSAGFEVEKISPVNMALLPPAILVHLWEKIFPPKETLSPLTNLPYFVNRLISSSLSVESWLLGMTDLPFGLGVIAVAWAKK